MRRAMFGLLTACALSLATLSACSTTVRVPPPPPKAEVKPAPPWRDAVWINGHWKHKGGGWVWVPGHWAKAKPGRAWVDGHWEKRGGGWVWVKGHWR
jgi:hypothetical protein